MKWPLISLKQICNTQYGYTASADDFNVGPKYLRITDIASGPIDWESVPYCKISESDYPKYRLNAGDIVIARTGNTTGYAKLIREDNNAIFASYLVRIKIKSDLAYSGYIGRLVESDIYKNFVKSIKGGAAQGNANATTLTLFKFRLPPIEIQKTIASILSTYDDLFDNNRKRIQLLEESARLLFREWFVYFRFPLRLRSGQARHEKVHPIRKSNSNGVKIVDGVPEGWEKGSVKDIAKVKSGYAFDSKDWLDEGNPVIKIGNITGDGTVNLDDCSYIDHNVASKTKDFVLKKGDLLIAMTGATVGKVGLLSENEKIAYLNQRVGKFIPQFEGAELILYCFFMSDTAQNHITNYAGGAAQANISASQIESIKIVVAPQDIYNQFIGLIKSTFEQILNLRNQNQKLAQARDLLLPRLMSGAIDPVRYDKLSNGVEV